MSNNTVLITGASRGLGRALAAAFANQGYNLVLNCRGEGRPDIGKALCTVVPGDLREDSVILQLVASAKEHNVNTLINNAGLYHIGTILDMGVEEAQAIIDVNLVVPVKLTLLLWPLLKVRNGTVVNINSVAGRQMGNNELVYRASKWGLTGFSGVLQYDGIRDGVRVIDIPFGMMKTKMTAGRAGWESHIDPNIVAALLVRICESKNSWGIKHDIIQGNIINNEVAVLGINKKYVGYL